jgi:hypothetical protein
MGEDGAPDDPGPVVIEPGYALDSMGNDIILPTPVDLDIEELLKQLPGDPPEDPVKPYTTPDSDPTPSTEPTRIRESPRFELRNDDPVDPKTQERLKKTLEEPGKKKKPVEE